MAGGIIEVTIPPLLGPHVTDYLYTYEGESGRISDTCNRFTLMQNNRIVIMDPCMDCSIELTPVICNSSIYLILRKFSVNITIRRLCNTHNINEASTNPMVNQVSQTCNTCIWSLSIVTTVSSLIIATLVAIIITLACKLK